MWRDFKQTHRQNNLFLKTKYIEHIRSNSKKLNKFKNIQSDPLCDLTNYNKMIQFEITNNSIKHIKCNSLSDLTEHNKMEKIQRESSQDIEFIVKSSQKTKEHDIIESLKNALLYDEWVKNGSKFGMTWCPPDKYSTFVTYKNAYGENIDVNFVGNYDERNNVICTPVLYYVGKSEKNTFVRQNEFLIVDNDKVIMTAGLLTCSALIMYFGNKKFLAHFDASSNINISYNAIINSLEDQNLTTASIKNVKIYHGLMMHEYSLNKAIMLCTKLDINCDSIQISDATLFDEIHA